VLHLLSNQQFEGFDVVRELASARALIVLAHEGVLVPLEASASARIDDRTRALLRAAALLFPCAVVTAGSPPGVAALGERVPSLTILAGQGEAKVEAVERFAKGFPPWPTVYLGSSPDDELVFRSPLVTHTIRVGRSTSSSARYFVSGRGELDGLLSQLVMERARIAGLDAGWHQLDRDRIGGSR
jgi:hypothetical protein